MTCPLGKTEKILETSLENRKGDHQQSIVRNTRKTPEERGASKSK
jgi:hypothetical protein